MKTRSQSLRAKSVAMKFLVPVGMASDAKPRSPAWSATNIFPHRRENSAGAFADPLAAGRLIRF